jgi:DNA polymerase-3 subunit gamma/tau
VFSHILDQPAAAALAGDKARGTLAPSMLFSGPPGSGKGTAGLAFARLLSCKNPQAPPECACESCVRHLILTHPDMLCLGSRAFSTEISAGNAALRREPGERASRLCLVRGVRKLLARFSPVLWEDEPKFGKIAGSAAALEEALDELWTTESAGHEALVKQGDSIVKAALKLEAEGMSDLIPIGQIRRAAGWSRLAPLGKWKFLLIENADRMQDQARNSLLKILEEPPDRLFIILTACREKALLPTITSRVRPYRFIRRTGETEAQVIRAAFRDSPAGGMGIGAYLDSFLPVSENTLRALAALLLVYIVHRIDSEEFRGLEDAAAAVAASAGIESRGMRLQTVISTITAKAEKFEVRGLFPRFLALFLGIVSENRASSGAKGPAAVLWHKRVDEAARAAGIYNQSPALALERLAVELRRDAADT